MEKDELRKMQQNMNEIKQNIVFKSSGKSGKRKQEKFQKAVDKEVNRIKHPTRTKMARSEQIVVGATVSIVVLTCVFSTSIFAITMSDNIKEIAVRGENESTNCEEVVEKVEEKNEDFVIEANENPLELENILLENVSILKSKEYSDEKRDIGFETIYTENPNLPEGEEVVTKQGKNGTQRVKSVKYYENDVFISEEIIETIPLIDPVAQLADIGTSKFLGDNKIHIGDNVYLLEETYLKQEKDENSGNSQVLVKSIDVKLDELCDENWCKVTYDEIHTGYLETKYLTSSYSTPEVVEENRIQRIKVQLNENIPLNQSTGMTLEDYKKILVGNPQDVNNIISDNVEAFYNAEKKYNVNGIFLAAIAIHESNWGTSTIAQEKKNLFGYGSYDSSPYSSSFEFENYADGIELLAKVMSKYYLNDKGTVIYDGEIAKGTYYRGNIVSAVNERYASDPNWSTKVYGFMQYLYNRL